MNVQLPAEVGYDLAMVLQMASSKVSANDLLRGERMEFLVQFRVQSCRTRSDIYNGKSYLVTSM